MLAIALASANVELVVGLSSVIATPNVLDFSCTSKSLIKPRRASCTWESLDERSWGLKQVKALHQLMLPTHMHLSLAAKYYHVS